MRIFYSELKASKRRRFGQFFRHKVVQMGWEDGYIWFDLISNWHIQLCQLENLAALHPEWQGIVKKQVHEFEKQHEADIDDQTRRAKGWAFK